MERFKVNSLLLRRLPIRLTSHRPRHDELDDVIQWTDQAIATAQKIRASTSAADAAKLVTELNTLTTNVNSGLDANKDGQIGWQMGEGGLQQAQAHMGLMMKGEG